MKRFTEKQPSGYDLKILREKDCAIYCESQYDCADCELYAAINKLAEYEDLEEQNRLIRLPVAVGEFGYTYAHEEILMLYVKKITIDSNIRVTVDTHNEKYGTIDVFANSPYFEKYWFKTREAAENALKERLGKNE